MQKSHIFVLSTTKNVNNYDYFHFPNLYSIKTFNSMKKIEAIIRHSLYKKVKYALRDIGINFFTMYEVKGRGLQKGDAIKYRGSVINTDYISRLQIEIIANDDKVEAIVDAILNSARTGEVGDGKIVISPVEKIIRIRTGDVQDNAL